MSLSFQRHVLLSAFRFTRKDRAKMRKKSRVSAHKCARGKSVHRSVANARIARKRRNFIACLICPDIIMFYSAILRAILPHRHTEVSSKVPNPINRHQLICPRSVVSAMLWSSIPKQEKQAATRLELEASIVIIDFSDDSILR